MKVLVAALVGMQRFSKHTYIKIEKELGLCSFYWKQLDNCKTVWDKTQQGIKT